MRAKIELIRVDNRLVHGQVGVTWVNALNIDTIVVVDDETAINVFSQKMMKTIAKASNVDIRFYSIADFMQVLRHNESSQRLFVVVRDIQTVYEMFKNAINNPDVLKEINKVSTEYLNTLSWQNTGKECVEILKSLK